jgi:hypothetical protein
VFGPLKDLPVPVAAKNPFVSGLYGPAAQHDIPAVTLLTALAASLSTAARTAKPAVLSAGGFGVDAPREAVAAAAMAFLTGFVLPLFAKGTTTSAKVGDACPPEEVAALARGAEVPDAQPMFPVAFCRDPAETPTETSETWLPVTPTAVAAVDALLAVCKGFERAWMVSGGNAKTLVHLATAAEGADAADGWVGAVAAALPSFPEGCGPVLKLPSATAALLRALLIARAHPPTRLAFVLIMQCQTRRFFGSATHAPLVSDTGPSAASAAYTFACHVADVVCDPRGPLLAIVVQPRKGLIRVMPLTTLVNPW